jgi:hypothetical protein
VVIVSYRYAKSLREDFRTVPGLWLCDEVGVLVQVGREEEIATWTATQLVQDWEVEVTKVMLGGNFFGHVLQSHSHILTVGWVQSHGGAITTSRSIGGGCRLRYHFSSPPPLANSPEATDTEG